MRRRALRISRGADVSEHCARRHAIADLNSSRVRIKVCVVINATSFTDHGNRLSAKIVLTDVVDVPAGRGKNRCAAWREDVLTFMLTSVAAGSLPRICNLLLPDVFERHREPRVRRLRVKLEDVCVEDQPV